MDMNNIKQQEITTTACAFTTRWRGNKYFERNSSEFHINYHMWRLIV